VSKGKNLAFGGKRWDEAFDKAQQLKKLIIPFDYQAPSRSAQINSDTEFAR
jgi:hypothetical protein